MDGMCELFLTPTVHVDALPTELPKHERWVGGGRGILCSMEDRGGQGGILCTMKDGETAGNIVSMEYGEGDRGNIV